MPLTEPNFTLCDYFDQTGQRVERLYIVDDPGGAGTEEIREFIRSRDFDHVLDRMRNEASATGASTSLDDAALALHALLHEVEDKRLPIVMASRIVSVGLNFRKAVSIVDIMPALEANFGGKAVSWARGVFRRINLGSPFVH